MSAPPLRFLGVVLGSWICARATFLAPEWLTEEGKASEAPPDQDRALAPAAATAQALVPLPVYPSRSSEPPTPAAIVDAPPSSLEQDRPAVRLAMDLSSGHLALAPAVTASPPVIETLVQPASSPLPPSQPIVATLDAAPAKLAVSGWAIVREGAEPQLATAGVLGGSQAGVRATYRLNGSLALSGRVSSPLEGDGAEAAVGIEWQPLPDVPVKLLAERRQAIGGEGRSAFAVVAHGGISNAKVAGPVVADAYGQAGVVGAANPDPFVDGAVKVGVPVASGVNVGAGAWGAAQPGVARLDVGPQVTVELPGGGVNLRLSAEWRVRVAGDAEPGSGPAITVATSF